MLSETKIHWGPVFIVFYFEPFATFKTDQDCLIVKYFPGKVFYALFILPGQSSLHTILLTFADLHFNFLIQVNWSTKKIV